MTSIRTVRAFLLALVALGFGVVTLSAQGPNGTGEPGKPYVDNLIPTIPANFSQLYRFDYSSDCLNNARAVTTISPATPSGSVVPNAAATPSEASTSTITPTATVVANSDDPNRAGTIDGQPHGIAALSAIWYRFDYANNHLTGQRPRITITLVNGLGSGVDFQVYAPENIGGWWNNHPTGRGTMEMIDCATGEPSESGECQSPDLSWQGNFGADGTYWVRVVNNNNNPVNYLLTFNETQPAP